MSFVKRQAAGRSSRSAPGPSGGFLFQVNGIKELQEALLKLPKELVANNGGPVARALTSSMKPILETAKRTVPNIDGKNNVTGKEGDNSGRLARAIRVRRSSKKSGHGSEGRQVYINKGKSRDDQNGAYYAHMVEFGHRGYAPTHWFRDAMSSNKELALEIFRRTLGKSIARIAKKIGDENLRKVAAGIGADANININRINSGGVFK